MRLLAIGSLALSFLAVTAARAQPPATEALPSQHAHSAGDPSQLGRVHFALLRSERLPQQFDVNLGLAGGNFLRDLAGERRKFHFTCRTVHDHNTIPVNRQIAPARVDQVQAIAFLLSHITDTQFFRVEEFDNPSFERHAYNSVICRMRCSVR